MDNIGKIVHTITQEDMATRYPNGIEPLVGNTDTTEHTLVALVKSQVEKILTARTLEPTTFDLLKVLVLDTTDDKLGRPMNIIATAMPTGRKDVAQAKEFRMYIEL